MRKLTLNEIQQGSFQVLLKIKEIFEKNKWTYFLAYGTLIGAVRHNGFIPWDDDIDIWVPRKDYEKFIKYCIEHKEELYPFELFHYTTNKNYVYTIARFSDSRYRLDYFNTKQYGLGLFVDIYPLDGVNLADNQYRKKIGKIINKIFMVGSSSYPKSPNFIKNIFKYPYYFLYKNTDISKLLRKNDEMAQKYSFDKAEYFDCVVWEKPGYQMKREWLGNGIKKDFNGVEFNIPDNYHEILTELYHDYMKLPPEKERIAHHFYDAFEKE